MCFSHVHMSKDEEAAGTAVGVVLCCCGKGSISRPHTAHGHSACGYLSLKNSIEAVGIASMASTASTSPSWPASKLYEAAVSPECDRLVRFVPCQASRSDEDRQAAGLLQRLEQVEVARH